MEPEFNGEIVRLLEQGERFAVATIVDARGSTPQRVGARLLVRRDGSIAGTLGGGCIEAEVREVAGEAIASGLPRLLGFTLNEDIAVDYGLACGGSERIFVDPTLQAPRDLELARGMLAAARGERRGVVVQLLADGPDAPAASKLAVWEGGATSGDLGPLGAQASRVATRLLESPRPLPAVVRLDDGREAFADVFAEPPEVVVVGGGHVGYAIARVAKLLGHRVAVIDDREQFANRQRFPDADRVVVGEIDQAIAGYPATRNTAIVVVTRGHKYDYQALAAAARSNAGYVGLMGSRRKVALIYRQLRADGVPEERLRDIRAPIGLDIGAVSPQEIAVAIMAEITMVRLGGTGLPLRDTSVVKPAGTRTPT